MGIGQLSLPVLISLIVTLTACNDRGSPVAGHLEPGGTTFDHGYRAYDSSGNLMIVGTLKLVLSDSASVNGTWSTTQVAASDNVGPQVGTGKLTGTMSGKFVWLNLNPGWVDNNVFLQGTIADGRISGTWTWSTYAGISARGTFEAWIEATTLQ